MVDLIRTFELLQVTESGYRINNSVVQSTET